MGTRVKGLAMDWDFCPCRARPDRTLMGILGPRARRGPIGRGFRWAGRTIPRLASDVSVSLEGVGSYVPERRVSNEEILEYLRPVRPDGRPLEPEWVVKHLGIRERRLDYDFGGRRKRGPGRWRPLRR